ncbi:MAG: hypothetical protein PWQ27_227 [Kosmotoga sp.]|nr:hypothetical protein [Kosmotoga sp.]
MEDIIILKLFGPYKLFGSDGNSLFDTDISRENGIYFWTVKHENGYLIDYIGETGRTFWQRMKEHLIETLGGNYRICDPDILLQGKEKIIWNGLWRKGTKDKIQEFIKNYEIYAPIIKRYIEIHDVFLAPLSADRRKKRLIEGNIAKIIKEQKPPISNLLPSDIRYVYDRKKIRGRIHC